MSIVYVTQQPLTTTAPPITTHPSILNPNRSHHQTSHDSNLKPKQTPNYNLKKKKKKKKQTHHRVSVTQPLSTTAPPITTHLSFSNPNRSNQTSHDSHLRPKQNPNQRIKKNTHTHNGNSTRLTLQPSFPLIVTQQSPSTIHHDS